MLHSLSSLLSDFFWIICSPTIHFSSTLKTWYQWLFKSTQHSIILLSQQKHIKIHEILKVHIGFCFFLSPILTEKQQSLQLSFRFAFMVWSRTTKDFILYCETWKRFYSLFDNGVHTAIQQMDSCPSIASLSHPLPSLNSHLKMACQHPACLDHWSCPRMCTPFPHLSDFSISSHFLSSIPITTHFCLWPYTASSPLSTSLFFFSGYVFFFPFQARGQMSSDLCSWHQNLSCG